MSTVNAKFLSRRRFLSGVAGTCVGLPLLESLYREPAWAQSAPRKRFLSFHCSSGVNGARFRPGIGTLTAESFSGLSIEPLAPYAERMLIPRGIHGYPVGTYTGHREGTGQALTAARIHSKLVSRTIAENRPASGEPAPTPTASNSNAATPDWMADGIRTLASSTSPVTAAAAPPSQ